MDVERERGDLARTVGTERCILASLGALAGDALLGDRILVLLCLLMAPKASAC